MTNDKSFHIESQIMFQTLAIETRRDIETESWVAKWELECISEVLSSFPVGSKDFVNFRIVFYLVSFLFSDQITKKIS